MNEPIKGTGKCSMMEVREFTKDRWIIGHTSNGAIIYYARDQEDAIKTLKEWEAAGDLLEMLKEAKRTIRVHHGMGLRPEVEDDLWKIYQRSPEMVKINETIKKATKGE